jgi:hypothetical protein
LVAWSSLAAVMALPAGMDPIDGLATVAGAFLATALLGTVATSQAARFGVGWSGLCRATFGPGGAWLPVWLRAVVLGAWICQVALELAGEVASVTLPETRLPVAALLVIGAGLIGRAGLRPALGWASLGCAMLFVCRAVVVIYVRMFAEAAPAGRGESTVAFAIDSAWALLPVWVAAPDWLRFRSRSVPAAELAPLALLPAALLMAFTGDNIPADVPLPARVLDLLSALGGWLLLAPLCGSYPCTVAIAGQLPRVSWRAAGMLVTAGLCAGLAATSRLGGWDGRPLLLLPLLMLVADALVVRRGLLDVQALTERRPYGGITGACFAAVAALCLGCAFPWVPQLGPLGPWAPAAAASACAGAYVLLAPLERGLVAMVARVQERRRGRSRDSRRGPERTDPRFRL